MTANTFGTNVMKLSIGTIDNAIIITPNVDAPPASDAGSSAGRWTPVSRESELVAIVTDGEQLKELGAKSGWEHRIAAIKGIADCLSAAENLTLLRRIKKQASGDTFALALTPGVRMNAANAASLFSFLEDARRREAVKGESQHRATHGQAQASTPATSGATPPPATSPPAAAVVDKPSAVDAAFDVPTLIGGTP